MNYGMPDRDGRNSVDFYHAAKENKTNLLLKVSNSRGEKKGNDIKF